MNVLEETNAGVEVGGREGFVTKHIAQVAAETKASAWLPTPAGVAQAGQAKIADKPSALLPVLMGESAGREGNVSVCLGLEGQLVRRGGKGGAGRKIRGKVGKKR